MNCLAGFPVRTWWRPAAVLALLLSGELPVRAEESAWQLKLRDADSGIEVFLRSRGDAVPAFRGVMHLPTRVSALTAVLLDTERMPEWVYRTRRVVRLERQGHGRGVSQVITAMPWPLLDREAIVAWELTQDARTGAVSITGHSAAQRLPRSAELVRMPTFESRWRFTPGSGGRVEVLFEGHGDPGGSLESPLLRGFVASAVWEAPLRTMQGLQRMVLLPGFRDAQLPFIAEPP